MINRIFRGLMIAALLFMAACTYQNRVQLTLVAAPITPKQQFDLPPLPISDSEEWPQARENMHQILEQNVYGEIPNTGHATLIKTTKLDSSALAQPIIAGPAIAEQWQIELQADGEAKEFLAVLVLPQSETPVPLVLIQNFCGLEASVPQLTLTPLETTSRLCSDSNAFINSVHLYVFGRYAAAPPLEMILAEGYGVLIFNSGDFIKDKAALAPQQMDAFFPASRQGKNPIGTIGAWAFASMRMMDLLEQDKRIRADKVFTYGHSRQGKSALVAAAFDTRFAGSISHQSGTGGAALTRSHNGESITSITKTYPHWFTPAYAELGNQNSTDFDQHFLIAMLAPRSLLLGNARRDVWSDPVSTFRAAEAASPVWEMFNKQGMRAKNLGDYQPSADIAFWMRPGTHGQVKEDWPAFLQFLAAHK